MAGIVIHERILTENKMCEKIGNDWYTERNYKEKRNASVCKVVPTHQIPVESHVRLKSSTMTESLSYGRLPFYRSIWTRTGLHATLY